HFNLGEYLNAWFLPSPHHVSIESVNMRHVLKWRPPQAVCNTTLLYSVQFQGEFELRILNGSWLNAPDCQRIAHTRCDLTSDLASDADYNIHVRAQCGPSVSPWSKLPRAFNRRDTFLTAPQMAVAAVGGGLQVSFSELPLTVVVSVTVWKRDEEQQVRVSPFSPHQTKECVKLCEAEHEQQQALPRRKLTEEADDFICFSQKCELSLPGHWQFVKQIQRPPIRLNSPLLINLKKLKT
uniref:Fibronectin type-III domain-containing protein n=1 Tax=Myripristis murdjan TaxID=586833 RepID=A0A667ZK06_9TELE